ncbi:MAG: HDOD domain-containing protein [Syntrophobacteraceae bacterium]
MNPEKQSQSLMDIVREYASSEKLILPVFPAIAVELQQVMAEEDVALDHIARIIGRDQALASQVLKLANSAFFSGLNRVRTIREALMRMGTNQVFNCLVVSSQQGLYNSDNGLIDRYLQVLWKHALGTAIGTKWLLSKMGYSELSDEAFLGGLLHDIGKLLLLRVIENINSDNSDIRLTDEFISEILDSMHVEQGYHLMEEWCIPPGYCNIAHKHHTEDFDAGDVQLLAVRIVNQVCRKVGISLHPDSNIIPATLPESHALGVREITLAELEIVLEDAIEAELAV